MVLLALLVSPAPAQEDYEDEGVNLEKLGFFFRLELARVTPNNVGLGLGYIDKPPPSGEIVNPALTGTRIDGNFGPRFDPGFSVGVRLKGNGGNVVASFWQFDQRQDFTVRPSEGWVVAHSLSSPGAGFWESWDDDNGDGVVDENDSVLGVEHGSGFLTLPDGSFALDPDGQKIPVEGSEEADEVLDAAEDLNDSLTNEFFPFNTSSLLDSDLFVDLKTYDLEYQRILKKGRNFTFGFSSGLRYARISQRLDVLYREDSSFAVYTDTEEDPTGTDIDGDGDNDFGDADPNDGEGLGDGDNDSNFNDSMKAIDIFTQDDISAQIDVRAFGLKIGFSGKYKIAKKWSIGSRIAFSALYGSKESSIKEVFWNQRDAFPNFVDWDINGDGEVTPLDFDLNGDGIVDLDDWRLQPGQDYLIELDPNDVAAGMENALIDGSCWEVDPTSGTILLRPGCPVPESERNDSIVQEIRTLRDQSGKNSTLFTAGEIELGVDYRFSRFARLSFGFRTQRWFDVGSLRDVTDNTNRSAVFSPSGDLTFDGVFLALTVWPKL
jgi:hypothetical protein